MIGGLVLAGVSIVLIDSGIFHVVRIGTCGTSNNFVSTRPCPPGTGAQILSIIGGVFGALIAIAIFAARGSRSGMGASVSFGVIMWSLLFVTIALSVIYAAYGPGNTGNSGAKTTAIILGVIFVPMGLIPLPFALRGGGGGRRSAVASKVRSTSRRCPGTVMSVDDTGTTLNDNPRVKLTVRAEPPGEAPFTVVKMAAVSRVRIPRVGDHCVVLYDPANREASSDIDALPGFAYAPPPAAVALASAPVAPAPAAAPAAEEDPLAKIAALGQLRDRGLLTPAEFDAQKKRLLGEV
jgi:hypothetical protein